MDHINTLQLYEPWPQNLHTAETIMSGKETAFTSSEGVGHPIKKPTALSLEEYLRDSEKLFSDCPGAGCTLSLVFS